MHSKEGVQQSLIADTADLVDIDTMKISGTALSIIIAAAASTPTLSFQSIGIRHRSSISFRSEPRSLCRTPPPTGLFASSEDNADDSSTPPGDDNARSRRRLVQTLSPSQRSTLASEIARLETLVPKLAYVNRISEASDARRRIVELKARDPYYLLEDEMSAALEEGDFDTCRAIREEMRSIGGRPLAKNDGDSSGTSSRGNSSGGSSGGESPSDIMKRMGGMAAMMGGMEERKKPKPRWGPGSDSKVDIHGRPIEGSSSSSSLSSGSRQNSPPMGRSRAAPGTSRKTIGKGWGPRQRPGVSNTSESSDFKRPAPPAPKQEDTDPNLAAAASGDISETGSRPKPNKYRVEGDSDLADGIVSRYNNSSDVISNGVRVEVSSSYSENRSDPNAKKHCFVYQVRITNVGNDGPVQLLGRRFEIQTVGSDRKDVVQGSGVTGRQPILKRGETFEYTSTAPLNLIPQEKTNVAARMKGSYEFQVGSDGETRQAELGEFHFLLPKDS